MKPREKKIILILTIIWVITLPFKYLRYTNIALLISNFMAIANIIANKLYEVKKNTFYKAIRFLTRAGAFLLALVFIVGQLFINLTPYVENKKIYEGEIDYVIILGAGLRGKELSNSLKYRLDKFLELDISSDIPVVLSGGQGPNELVTEASAMAKYLIENGVESKRLILEEESTSTYENFKFSLEKIKDEKGPYNRDSNFAIITNDFHIFRSKYILGKMGYNNIGIGAKTPGIVKLDYFFREFFALANTILFDFK